MGEQGFELYIYFPGKDKKNPRMIKGFFENK
jgi:hypothetical protein